MSVVALISKDKDAQLAHASLARQLVDTHGPAELHDQSTRIIRFSDVNEIVDQDGSGHDFGGVIIHGNSVPRTEVTRLKQSLIDAGKGDIAVSTTNLELNRLDVFSMEAKGLQHEGTINCP